MDASRLQHLIYRGYAKAALRLGVDYDIYRSPSAINPLSLVNLVGTVKCSFNVNWAYDKPNKYGNAQWQLLADGEQLRVGDYLVGPHSTYFIAGMQPLLPILAVECSHTITIKRPASNTGGGYRGYSGYKDSTANVLYQNCPASMIIQRAGTINKEGLPMDASMPLYQLLIPKLGGIIAKTGDVVTDEQNVQYMIGADELTDFGWRMVVHEVGA